MSSSYEVEVGPLGAITRDSHYELYFQCRVELRLGNGRCVTKGCVQAHAAYTSYYSDADYPVTKVLREPVYVEHSSVGPSGAWVPIPA
ncbi:hypothetical protein MHYP_G00053580 [Metynnis hypsauchen]